LCRIDRLGGSAELARPLIGERDCVGKGYAKGAIHFLGVSLVLGGAGFGAYAWWRAMMAGTPATAGTVMLAVLPFLIGFELLLQAVILDIQQTPR